MRSTEERIAFLEERIRDLETLIFFCHPCPECGNPLRRIENRRILCSNCGIASAEMPEEDPE